MTRRWRILAPLAGGFWAMASLLGLGACGREAPRPQPPLAQVQAPAPDRIPSAALETLAYVRQHGHAAPGYVGGRVFGNYEGALPRYDAKRKRILYREWDVQPMAEHRNRGAERLVTGSDGRAWYTGDHYRTFTEVK